MYPVAYSACMIYAKRQALCSYCNDWAETGGIFHPSAALGRCACLPGTMMPWKQDRRRIIPPKRIKHRYPQWTRGHACPLRVSHEESNLTFLLQKNEPTGSWTFKEMFEQAGLTVGTAAIGRNLKMMDSHGYTVQVANKGRVLTDLGLEKASQNQAMYTALNLLIYQQRCIEWNAQAEGILEYSTTYAAIHEEILNAVRQHDPQLAAHLIKSHLLDIIHEIEKNTGTV